MQCHTKPIHFLHVFVHVWEWTNLLIDRWCLSSCSLLLAGYQPTCTIVNQFTLKDTWKSLVLFLNVQIICLITSKNTHRFFNFHFGGNHGFEVLAERGLGVGNRLKWSRCRGGHKICVPKVKHFCQSQTVLLLCQWKIDITQRSNQQVRTGIAISRTS